MVSPIKKILLDGRNLRIFPVCIFKFSLLLNKLYYSPFLNIIFYWHFIWQFLRIQENFNQITSLSPKVIRHFLSCNSYKNTHLNLYSKKYPPNVELVSCNLKTINLTTNISITYSTPTNFWPHLTFLAFISVQKGRLLFLSNVFENSVLFKLHLMAADDGDYKGFFLHE
uniref:Uncharacterized protein n=1 Tax=Heterorhabditis bacteriophora TaxID=37862 RepID=A0A1I7WZS2_HETBA